MQVTTPMTKINDRLSVPSHVHPVRTFQAVPKFRSIWRAMRRYQVGRDGTVYPSRPFNNSKRTNGRKLQKNFEVVHHLIQTLQNAKRIDTQNAQKP